MSISKRDESLMLDYLEQKELTAKEIVMILSGMAKKASGTERAALEQAVELLEMGEALEEFKKDPVTYTMDEVDRILGVEGKKQPDLK